MEVNTFGTIACIFMHHVTRVFPYRCDNVLILGNFCKVRAEKSGGSDRPTPRRESMQITRLRMF